MTPTPEQMRALARDADFAAATGARRPFNEHARRYRRIAVGLLEAADEVDRLRAVIENAPHDLECNESNVWRDGSVMPCTCWKADVL